MDTNQQDQIDISTLANIHEIQQSKISFSLEIDFNNNQLFGHTTINLTSIKDNVNKVVLDSKNIEINKVTTDTEELAFSINKTRGEDYPLGTPLEITLNSSLKNRESINITIHFKTTSKSEAIQWLNSQQTKGKNYPFMFTQCEAILARSLLPCQDSPSVKSTINANLKVRAPMTALYSGILKAKSSNGEYNMFEYVQDIPVPTYLICIAAGNLEYRTISSRCGVWAEPELAEKSQKEFEDTEVFIKTAENYLTPYEWKTYDMLVLPPGFAYGGMENPNLTFVTPSLLAGDKSLVNVIAHEIAHSWTGNLVTNNNWQNFWVNEGFTMFLERKIIELVYGRDMFLVEAYEGYQELLKTVEQIGPQHSFTSLTPDLKDVDPDDAFSIIPYEKGFLFLYYLENLVGNDVFQKILQVYIKTFRLKSVNYTDFKNIFETQVEILLGKDKAETIIKEVDWTHWVHHSGLPNKKFDYSLLYIKLDNSLIEKSHGLAKQFLNAQIPSNAKEVFDSFHTTVKLLFLYALFEEEISESVYNNLRDTLNLNSNLNDELASLWYQIAMKNKMTDVIPFVENYLSRVGRMRYLRPNYRLLFKLNRESALKTFETNRLMYSPVAARLVENDFKELSK